MMSAAGNSAAADDDATPYGAPVIPQRSTAQDAGGAYAQRAAVKIVSERMRQSATFQAAMRRAQRAVSWRIAGLLEI